MENTYKDLLNSKEIYISEFTDNGKCYYLAKNGKTVAAYLEKKDSEYDYVVVSFDRYKELKKETSDIKLFAVLMGNRVYQYLVNDLTIENGCLLGSVSDPIKQKKIYLIPFSKARLIDERDENNNWIKIK